MKAQMIMAAAVAGMTLGALGGRDAIADDKAGAKVHCAGINACAGKGACKSATNACAGKNGCKGKGWVEVNTAKECTDKGGKVINDKSSGPAPKSAD
jgi:hypothetical protein